MCQARWQCFTWIHLSRYHYNFHFTIEEMGTEKLSDFLTKLVVLFHSPKYNGAT